MVLESLNTYQRNELISFMQEHPLFARGQRMKLGNQGKQSFNHLWEHLCEKLNNLSDKFPRSVAYYQNLWSRARLKCKELRAQFNRASCKTGNCENSVPQLEPIVEVICNIYGNFEQEKFINAEVGLTVDKYSRIDSATLNKFLEMKKVQKYALFDFWKENLEIYADEKKRHKNEKFIEFCDQLDGMKDDSDNPQELPEPKSLPYDWCRAWNYLESKARKPTPDNADEEEEEFLEDLRNLMAMKDMYKQLDGKTKKAEPKSKPSQRNSVVKRKRIAPLAMNTKSSRNDIKNKNPISTRDATANKLRQNCSSFNKASLSGKYLPPPSPTDLQFEENDYSSSQPRPGTTPMESSDDSDSDIEKILDEIDEERKEEIKHPPKRGGDDNKFSAKKLRVDIKGHTSILKPSSNKDNNYEDQNNDYDEYDDVMDQFPSLNSPPKSKTDLYYQKRKVNFGDLPASKHQYDYKMRQTSLLDRGKHCNIVDDRPDYAYKQKSNIAAQKGSSVNIINGGIHENASSATSDEFNSTGDASRSTKTHNGSTNNDSKMPNEIEIINYVKNLLKQKIPNDSFWFSLPDNTREIDDAGENSKSVSNSQSTEIINQSMQTDPKKPIEIEKNSSESSHLSLKVDSKDTNSAKSLGNSCKAPELGNSSLQDGAIKQSTQFINQSMQTDPTKPIEIGKDSSESSHHSLEVDSKDTNSSKSLGNSCKAPELGNSSLQDGSIKNSSVNNINPENGTPKEDAFNFKDVLQKSNEFISISSNIVKHLDRRNEIEEGRGDLFDELNSNLLNLSNEMKFMNESTKKILEREEKKLQIEEQKLEIMKKRLDIDDKLIKSHERRNDIEERRNENEFNRNTIGRHMNLVFMTFCNNVAKFLTGSELNLEFKTVPDFPIIKGTKNDG